MSKWIKRIFIALAILIVLVLAAAIIIPIVFKDKIEAAVKTEVNKNVNAVVDWGDWDITLFKNFPDLTVVVNNLKVSGKAPFEGVDLARIGSLNATVAFWSLFDDHFDIIRVGLTKPYIHIRVMEDGKANYDIAMPDSTATDLPTDSSSAFSFALREYFMENGHIIYEDVSLPVVLDLANVKHNGRGDFKQDLFTLETTTHIDTVNVVYEGIKYLKNAKADLDADLDMDMANMKFTLKDNVIKVNQLEVGLDGWLAMPTDDIDMDITWEAKRTDLGMILSLVPAAFAKDLDGVVMSGKVKFGGFVKGKYGEKDSPGYGLDLNIDNGRFKYPDLPKSCESIFVDLNVNNPDGKDDDGMVVDLKRFALKMGGNPVEARMYLTKPITAPVVDAELRAQVDLVSIKDVVPLEKGDDLKGELTADVKMKGAVKDIEAQQYDKFTAEGKLILLDMAYKSDSLPLPVGINSLYFDFSPKFLSLTSFDGTVGTSSIQAKGRLDNYLQWWLKDSTLVGSFDMTANKFDMNELMGPEETPVEGAPADTSSLSVIEVPGNINFRMGVKVNEVIYDQMHLTNVRGDMHIHDKRVDLKDVFFNLFEGTVAMDGYYDTKDMSRPIVDLGYNVKDLDIEQTVKYVDAVQKMAPIAKTAKGKFSTDLKMQADLSQQMEPIMSTLTGNGTLKTKSVRIDGFQPLVDIAKALKINKIENTTLQDILFSYRFADGKMITDPFDVKIDRIKANVGGTTAFDDQAIDYTMKAKIPSDIFGAQANSAIAGLLGKANNAIGSNFQVPAELDAVIKITGTITNPIIKPQFAGGTANVKDAIVTEVKAELNDQIDKAKEEAIAKAREEAAKLIAEAQKQADELKAKARQEAASIKAQAFRSADDELAKVTNPLAKVAAKLVADKAKEAATKKEQQAIAEADKRADSLVQAARVKGDDYIKKAEDTNTTVK